MGRIHTKKSRGIPLHQTILSRETRRAPSAKPHTISSKCPKGAEQQQIAIFSAPPPSFFLIRKRVRKCRPAFSMSERLRFSAHSFRIRSSPLGRLRKGGHDVNVRSSVQRKSHGQDRGRKRPPTSSARIQCFAKKETEKESARKTKSKPILSPHSNIVRAKWPAKTTNSSMRTSALDENTLLSARLLQGSRRRIENPTIRRARARGFSLWSNRYRSRGLPRVAADILTYPPRADHRGRIHFV